ncbi:MAG: GNAT family N-acetyltransferase [Bacteroidetes bacterium]|jgi:diamine N-acetyltransferase|nr:GNAT family N-acetyltransferase [Bacteroidota bacterium]MBT6685309.1 GNAT family N-acetyltransferase [Bacteroidota bacterium]MBT7143432.1 GNAT family N-acetyltransferase [Bacteroidota bacterium]MBT7491454.1 GNAT family N-acetyltransferase [Bacteroidota bacterium]
MDLSDNFTDILKLENDFVKLRAIELSDADIIYKWENDPSVWKLSNTIVPFSRYIIRKYVENSHLDIYETKQLRLMIDAKNMSENSTIGAIDMFDFDPYHNRAGIGILIGEDENKGKGYASAALELFINYAFSHLGLHQLFCNITANNDHSLNLFRKHKFEIVGEKKEWIKTHEEFLNEYMLQLINE